MAIIMCDVCGHPGSHAVVMTSDGWPKSCDQCLQCQTDNRKT